MNLIRATQDQIALSLNETEYEGIAQAFNEVCNGFRVSNFEQRIGTDENTVLHLLDQFHPRRRTDLMPLAEPLNVTIAPASGNHFSVRITPKEARVIANCLLATLDEIQPSEYQTRMGIGFGVDAAKKIVSELESVLNLNS